MVAKMRDGLRWYLRQLFQILFYITLIVLQVTFSASLVCCTPVSPLTEIMRRTYDQVKSQIWLGFA